MLLPFLFGSRRVLGSVQEAVQEAFFRIEKAISRGQVTKPSFEAVTLAPAGLLK